MKKIITWLKAHPLIKIHQLEEEAGIPARTLHKAILYDRSFPEKYAKQLERVLKKYGYK